jgi:hypothetical protein
MMAVRRNAGTTAVAEPDDASFAYEPEEDAAPSSRSSSVTRRGWDTAKKVIAANKAAFANDWSLPEDEVIIKFLEDEPFWSIGQHWIDQIRDGKKSFYCIADEYGEGCPLCDFGDRPRALSYFNVMPVNGGADAFQVKALKAGPMLTEVIQKHHENTNRGPIDRHFWAVSVSKPAQGKRGKVTYNMSVVKERDLVDDYEMDVSIVRRKIKDAKLWTEADFTMPTEAELEEIRDVYLDV